MSTKFYVFITGCILVFTIIFLRSAILTRGAYRENYTKAVELYENGDLDAAYDLFHGSDFKDSKEYEIKIINTWRACYYIQIEEYEKAEALKTKYDLIHINVQKNN